MWNWLLSEGGYALLGALGDVGEGGLLLPEVLSDVGRLLGEEGAQSVAQ